MHDQAPSQFVGLLRRAAGGADGQHRDEAFIRRAIEEFNAPYSEVAQRRAQGVLADAVAVADEARAYLAKSRKRDGAFA